MERAEWLQGRWWREGHEKSAKFQEVKEIVHISCKFVIDLFFNLAQSVNLTWQMNVNMTYMNVIIIQSNTRKNTFKTLLNKV